MQRFDAQVVLSSVHSSPKGTGNAVSFRKLRVKFRVPGVKTQLELDPHSAIPNPQLVVA